MSSSWKLPSFLVFQGSIADLTFHWRRIPRRFPFYSDSSEWKTTDSCQSYNEECNWLHKTRHFTYSYSKNLYFQNGIVFVMPTPGGIHMSTRRKMFEFLTCALNWKGFELRKILQWPLSCCPIQSSITVLVGSHSLLMLELTSSKPVKTAKHISSRKHQLRMHKNQLQKRRV